MRRSAILLVLGLVLAVWGSAFAQQVTVVDIRDFAFEPHEVKVTNGATVRWVNRDSAPHSIAMEGGRPGSSGQLDPGKEHALTFSDAGRFTYRCGVHPTMLGIIVVD
jgi:plastocyanin